MCVTISDPDDWADHEALLDWAFRSWSYRSVGDVAYVLPVISGKSDACTAVPGEDVRVLLEPGETVRVTAELPRFVFAPLHAGETVGMLTVTAPDGTQQKTPLVCTGDVAADAAIRLTPYERLERCWRLAGHSIFSFNPDF